MNEENKIIGIVPDTPENQKAIKERGWGDREDENEEKELKKYYAFKHKQIESGNNKVDNLKIWILANSLRDEKEKQIDYRKSFDPEYIEKSKESICKDCINNRGFNGEFYDCEKADERVNLEIEYKREGVFYTQIIKCKEYIRVIWIIAPGLKAVRVN